MAKVASKSECVKVVIRCRPLNEKEKSQGHDRIVEMDSSRGIVDVRNPSAPGEAPKQFTFDAVYDWNSKQKNLYDETFRDLVQAVLDGFNGTIFAYGQTGTGKTFTMQGVKNDPELRGVIPNSFEHIFQHIARSQNQQYLVRASYLEIYMEEIRDLLHKDQAKRLELKERPDTGVYVKDLSSFVTKSIKEIEHVMNVGNQNRSVGSTNMNEQSSRSHAIFIITVECSENSDDGENHIRVGKLNMVDLAGSERQAKTGAEGERLKEATKINLSLSALGNVISALVDAKSSHIPYRDSKLTRLLQDSLGGNAKTVMVANIGPASWNFDETITTLRYANRAKSIKNKPKINEDPKDALLREFQEEIARLKAALGNKGGGGKKKQRIGADGQPVYDDDDGGELDDETRVEAFKKEQEEKLDAEKQRILNDKSLIAEEKEKLLIEAKNKAERLRQEEESKEALAKKIQAMESKLLCGGKDIVDHTNEQQRVLDQKRREIIEEQRREREMQEKLQEKEETALGLQENFVSLQQEVDIKTKKLKKLFNKLQSVKQEINELQEVHIKERQELEQMQNELVRELKLKVLIIENFIPPEEKEKVSQRAYFDEDEDTWKLQPLAKAEANTMAKRPLSACGGKRPVSEFARKAAVLNGSYRFKGENIMTVELDMPNQTTRDYEGPAIAPHIQAALDVALKDEEDIDIDSSVSLSKTKVKTKKKTFSDNSSQRSSSRKQEQSQFPTSRGLVPK